MSEFDCPDLVVLKHLKWSVENLIARNPKLFTTKEKIWRQNHMLIIDKRIRQLEDAQSLEA